MLITNQELERINALLSTEVVRDRAFFDSEARTLMLDKGIVALPDVRTIIQILQQMLPGLIVTTRDLTFIGQQRAQNPGAVQRAETEDQQQVMLRRTIDMVIAAAEYGASDIHIHVRDQVATIIFVINGESRLVDTIPAFDGVKMCRAVYQGLAKTSTVMLQENIAQNVQIPGKDTFPSHLGIESVRVVRGPSYSGQFVTMRMQYSGTVLQRRHKIMNLPYPPAPEGCLQLGAMGYSDEQVRKVLTLMSAPNGIVFVVGPTGSGKTTSIYELLNQRMRQTPYHRLVTAEDPVEIPMPHAVQINVGGGIAGQDVDATRSGFQDALRTMLRMAPKIIMVGEIRDEGVASLALEAAVTGHSVVTTMHVDDAFQVVDRLENMGDRSLNRRTFCDPKKIRGIIAQRIIPHLCPNCSIPIEPDTYSQEGLIEELSITALKTWGNVDFVRKRNPQGCEQCQLSGIVGRMAVAEVVITDALLMNDFIEHGTAIARQHYHSRRDVDMPMFERAVIRVLQGLVDPVAVTHSIDQFQDRPEDRPLYKTHRDSTTHRLLTEAIFPSRDGHAETSLRVSI